MSNPTELPDLDRLEALARAATIGPWLHRHDPGNPVGFQHCVKMQGEFGTWICDCLDNADRSVDGGVAGERNASFIAAANPAAVLALIALARRAQPEGEAPQAETERYRYLATLQDWSEIERLCRSSTASSAAQYKRDLDKLIDERRPAAQHADSGAPADRIKELESLVGVAEAELRSMDRDLAAARASLAAQPQGAQVYQVFSQDSGEWYEVPQSQYERANPAFRRVIAAQQAAATGAPGTPEAPKGGA